ncbi:MAG: hypothetical protein AAF633_20545 [Chloroflexota bacterium]
MGKSVSIKTTLVHWGDHHAVVILSDNHVQLRWGWTYFKMRMADLLVLNQVIQDWLEAYSDSLSDYDRVNLRLDEERIYLSTQDFIDLCDMVEEAIEVLPRKVVRWIDLDVEITPFQPTEVSETVSPSSIEDISSFSMN